MSYLIVTNNDKCQAYFEGKYTVEYQMDWSYRDVLVHCRDLVHSGWKLMTHPMAGSLKPNQTPYRSVVLAKSTTQDKTPWEDVERMESSIDTCDKFMNCRTLPDWPDHIQNDFKTLDLSFIQGAVEQIRARV